MKKNAILDIKRDPMGAAILDCQRTGKASSLRVMSSMFEDDEMPVAHLFRSFDQMPRLEQKALETARGRVLDIGAGAWMPCAGSARTWCRGQSHRHLAAQLRGHEGARHKGGGVCEPV